VSPDLVALGPWRLYGCRMSATKIRERIAAARAGERVTIRELTDVGSDNPCCFSLTLEPTIDGLRVMRKNKGWRGRTSFHYVE